MPLSSVTPRNGYVDKLESNSTAIWDQKVPNTELERFKKIVEKKYSQHFDSYWDLHKWSVEHYTDFWKEIWHFFDVIASKPYDEVFVKTGPGLLDNEWFSGARLNFAENLLRIRDDRLALICFDEFANYEEVTFAEMFKEVERYTAAFRKHGLSIGDRVACIMTNRKEAIFAMLATTSIGAIWSGPLPSYGPKIISNLINFLDPTFILALDHFHFAGKQFDQFEKLVAAAESSPNLKKIVVLATRPQTVNRLSEIRKSMLLEDFLESGKNLDGTVPELVFEQLPFDHPVALNFTSGTTGLPKGVLHSAGTFIAILRNFGIHFNLKEGDTVYTYCPVGWSSWDDPIPNLALGVKLFLFAGSASYNKKGVTLWDCFSKFDITYACLTPSCFDIMENTKILPEPGMNFESLKIVALEGSPAKLGNYKFLQNVVKKDLCVCSSYGCSEVFGMFSGLDLNLPGYAIENQVPSLGVDLHVFDEEGRSIIGKIGEVVVTTPTPSFPVYLWRDENNAKLNETYFSKYPGVWSQNDEGWVNPKTKGFAVIGRSDNTIKQDGVCFFASDVYFGIEKMEELDDYICATQDRWDGDSRAVLFVKVKKGYSFTPELKQDIIDNISREVYADIVPKAVLEIEDIPYNLNHKRMESTITKILNTNSIPEVSGIKNRESLQYYINIPEILKYNKI